MAPTAQKVATLVDMLPEQEQTLAYEFVKRLVLAWDPDFTRVTPSEAAEIEKARAEYEAGETISHDSINWD